MTIGPARGTALRRHVIRYRFEKREGGGNTALDLDVARVRKLLRTDLSVGAIATLLGVSRDALMHFIRRRNICDLTARRVFISRQQTQRKLETT